MYSSLMNGVHVVLPTAEIVTNGALLGASMDHKQAIPDLKQEAIQSE